MNNEDNNIPDSTSAETIDDIYFIYLDYIGVLTFLVIGIASTFLGELVFNLFRQLGAAFVGFTYIYLWKTHKKLGGKDYIFISSKYTTIPDIGIVLIWFVVFGISIYYSITGISMLRGLGHISPLSPFGITQCCLILLAAFWIQAITTKIRQKLLTVGYVSGSMFKFICELRSRSNR